MNACVCAGASAPCGLSVIAARTRLSARALVAATAFVVAANVTAADAVKLRTPIKIDRSYAGDRLSTSALKAGAAHATAVASADFDRNGTPDVAIGYSSPSGGIVTLQRGNPEAFAPTDDAVFARLQKGYDPPSLLPDTRTFAVPESPDFLVAGTFGDGGPSIVFAHKDGGLYLMRSDGRGGLGEPRKIALPGIVTSLAAGEFRAADGLTDIAVGVTTKTGHALMVFEDARNGFAKAALELPVSSPLVAIQFGGLDDDAFQDIAAVTDRELLIVHGWSRASGADIAARIERVAIPSGTVDLAVGEFVWDRAGRSEIATLAADGSVSIVRGADLDTRKFTKEEAATRTRGYAFAHAQPVTDVEKSAVAQAKQSTGWIVSAALKSTASIVGASAGARRLMRANLSYGELDDLMVVGDRGVEVVHEVARMQKADASALKRTTLPSSGNPVAVMPLPKKLNGVRDFVVLDANADSTLVPQAPTATITVDRFDDPAGAALTAASACTGAASDCSLRGAIQFANATSNTTINLPAGTYVLSINGTNKDGCAYSNGTSSNPDGDLGLNTAMTLVGAGAASTVVRQTGTGLASDGDRVMCLAETFPVGLVIGMSGFTIVGGRDGAQGGSVQVFGGGAIIGGELSNSLTLTNMVFANNWTTGAGLGGAAVQITGGDLIITNSTFGGSSAPGLYTDRSSTNTANASGTSGGGVSFTPSSPMHMGGTGNLTVTGTTFSRNTSLGAGGAGADVYILAFASPGGIGTGVTNFGGNTLFQNNQALSTGSGAGLLDESIPTTVANSTFTNNAANNRGGAVYVAGSNLLFDGTTGAITMTGNTAPSGGTSVSTASAVAVSGTNTTLGGSIEISSGGSWTNNTGSILAPTDVVVTGGTFTMNNSTMNVAGNLTVQPAAIQGATFNGNTGTVNIAGNFSYTPGGSGPVTSFNAGTGTFNFNGTGAQSITNGASITFNNLTDSNTAQPLTLNNSLAVNGTLNVNGANAILSPVAGTVISGTGTLTGTGTARASRTAATADFLNQYTLTNKTLTNLTVDYSGAGNQTVNNTPVYSNLTISGSGTKTLQGNTSITGNLNIAAATFASGNFNFALNGNWTNAATFTPGTGLVVFSGTSGTQLLTGNTTFFNLTLNNPGATTNFGTGTTTIGNDLVASAGTMDGGTSTVTFTGTGDNAGSFSGAATKNFHHLLISAPATITNNSGGDVVIEGNLGVTGQFVQAAGITTTFATDNNGVMLHNLTGGGGETFGNVAISPSNTVDAGVQSFGVVGSSFTVSGTLTGGTTASFTGAVPQTITGDGSKSFNNLTINNANGVTLANGAGAVDASVAGALTLTSDLTVASGAVLQQSGTSAGAGDALGTVRRTDLGATPRAFGNPNNLVTIDSGVAPTQLDFTLAKAAPSGFPGTAKVVPRDMVLMPTGGSGYSATLRLHYLDPELTAPGITESRLGQWKLVGAVWTPQGGTVDTANNYVTLSGITSLAESAIAEVSDLTLTKANNVGGAAVVGQPWNWTLTAANTGTQATFAAGQTILSDQLPNANVVYGPVTVTNVSNIAGSASIGCSIASNTLTCTATTGSVTFFSSAGTSSFDVVFSATPQAAGSFQNPRSGGSAQIDPAGVVVESNEGNNAPTTNTVTVSKASTTTTITSDNPDPSLSGQSFTVAWSVAVNSPGALGAALTGNVTVSDGTVSCMAAVSAGQCNLTLATGGNHNLTATYAGDANYNGSASSPATPHTVTLATPTIAKAFAPSTIAAGGTTTVTLTLSNSNAVALTNASFTDSLTNMSAVGGAVTGTCAGTTPNTLVAGTTALSFSGITIPLNGSCTVIFSVTSSSAGTRPNTTSGVTTTETPSAGTPSNTATLTVTPTANLSITKTDGAAATTPSASITYTIVAGNAGPSDATGASVNDTLPPTLTNCSWTCAPGTGQCTASGFGSIADTVNIPNGGNVTYTLNCTVSSQAVGTVANTATVAAPGGTTDPVPGNNSATDTDTLPPRPDLTIAKSHAGAFQQGDVGRTYSLTVTNSGDGPTDGTTITVTDVVPAGLTPTGASGTGWSCGIASQTMTCTRSDALAASASFAAITLTVDVAANAAAMITNTASVSGGGNANTANDSASDPTAVNSALIFKDGFE